MVLSCFESGLTFLLRFIIHLVLAESSMEIFLDSVSVINMNFDTLTSVNYSRQSQLTSCNDATVGINIAQQQPLRRANKSLRRSKQSLRKYSLFGDQNSQVAHIRNVFLRSQGSMCID